jgi:hypothetical protein
MKIRIGEHAALGTVTCRLSWLRLSLGMIVSFVGALGFALPEVAFARSARSSPTIRARVNNYTQASDAVLASAEREASRIFEEAGLTVVWLNCPMGHSIAIQQDPCNEAPEPTDVILRVLSAPARNEFQHTVFGFAVRPLLASVYYDHVLLRAMSDAAQFEVHFILGAVIAHEIGHLLIDSNGHSNAGVMQASWDRKQIRQAVTGNLFFTAEQARLIQAETEARTKLRSAIPRRDVGLNARVELQSNSAL